jgi:hypothetical protein
MKRDDLDFVLVGSIGAALALYLFGAILNDFGLFPFYIDTPRAESATAFLLGLAGCLLLFLPVAFFLEKHMMRIQQANKDPYVVLRHQDEFPKAQVWRAVDPRDRDEENRARSK